MTMTIYPAIDLKQGKCVRLLHGEMDKATVYNDSPAAQADAFGAAGFDWLHIVDLDGAFSGDSANKAAVEAILGATKGHTQLGGGIRTMESVSFWLETGISRVILGTAAVSDPDFVKAAGKAFPGQVVVGVDARNGMVATEGWAETTSHTAVDIGRRFEDAGMAGLLYTDISRDGALTGVDIEGTAALADAVSIPVIASGGVASVKDVIDLRAKNHSNIDGVIIGRALYDGRISPEEALAAAKAI